MDPIGFYEPSRMTASRLIAYCSRLMLRYELWGRGFAASFVCSSLRERAFVYSREAAFYLISPILYMSFKMRAADSSMRFLYFELLSESSIMMLIISLALDV